ncbi:hypothetical protein [Nonomuraea bangladeshensis]|uniref:hypothetical protein n=1 Tax=Nonomuraea bangladeshensis TaxID=404385 RepID=UPI003C2BEC39
MNELDLPDGTPVTLTHAYGGSWSLDGTLVTTLVDRRPSKEWWEDVTGWMVRYVSPVDGETYSQVFDRNRHNLTRRDPATPAPQH